jgi:hypothetical protein
MTRLAAALILVLAALQTRPAAQPPTLIVQIVVDQMRGSYVEQYRSQWTAGLRRLLTEGAYFKQARYPYAVTVTCAGHSSIGTGTTPSTHGMVMNEWWDRETGRRTTCTSDPAVTPIGFTREPSGRYSGRNMLSQTFAERLDASQAPEAGRVATFSMKPRSAIGLAGHSGDAVIWFDLPGTFATSSAFGMPAWLSGWIKARPIEPLVSAEWTRARPARAYQGTDADRAARPTPGWTVEFPHKLSDTGTADNVFYDRWQRSPYSDAYLTDMALAAIDAMALGQREGIDYLGVSYSALDLVGHKFGPRSHEVQDVLIRLDEQIGRLLAHLDRTVGRGRYVLALSADHGVGEVPEEEPGARGRLPRGLAAKTIESVLDKYWGLGGNDTQHVAHDYYTDFYLTRATKDRLAGDPAALTAVTTALEDLPGVLRAATWIDMSTGANSKTPVWEGLRLSYHPQRSGDLMLLMRENFTTSTDAASHGTYYDYDRRVPVILFGSTFKAGTFEGPASPLDIAATWSRLTGVALDRPFGHSLDVAVK